MSSPNLVTNLLDRRDGQRGRCHRHYCSTTQMSTSNILIDRTVNWLLVCYMILFMGAFSKNSIVCLGLLKHSPVKHDEYSTVFLDKPTQGLAGRISVPTRERHKGGIERFGRFGRPRLHPPPRPQSELRPLSIRRYRRYSLPSTGTQLAVGTVDRDSGWCLLLLLLGDERLE